MSFNAVNTNHAPTPRGSYSQAIVTDSLLFTAGIGPFDWKTGDIMGTTIEEQTENVLQSLSAILAEVGLAFRDVIKTTVHLHNLERDFSGFNRIYGKYFHEPYPVRTTVGSTLNGILVEIDVVAVRPNASSLRRPAD